MPEGRRPGGGGVRKPVPGRVFCEVRVPGRSLAPNLGMAAKLSEIRPDVVYLSSCLVNARPGCPYADADELAEIIQSKTGLRVVKGTHDYH